MDLSSHYIALLRQSECPDATYLAAEPPLVFHRAKGPYVWDVDGRRYLDLCAGFGVMALGHASAAHRQVFAEQLEDFPPVIHGMGDVYGSSAKAELLDHLARALPSPLDVGCLALSGSQAVEFALKTALMRKPGVVITFQGSYHGLELGVLPLTSRQAFKRPFHSWIRSDQVIELPFGCQPGELDEAVRAIAQSGETLSAILVEPIQGRAGIRPARKTWLSELRDFSDQHDALLIYDEVFTGLGRSGRLTFSELVPCDILCLGKALGGGLPLSACFASREIMAAWPTNTGEALHTGTFFGHPLTCRLASATLSEIITLLPSIEAKGEFFKEKLSQELGGHPLLKEIRGEGLMLAIELVRPELGVELMHVLRELGLITLVSGERGEVLSLTPPLIISNEQIELAVQLISQGLKRL